jgi:hypothetical protein
VGRIDKLKLSDCAAEILSSHDRTLSIAAFAAVVDEGNAQAARRCAKDYISPLLRKAHRQNPPLSMEPQ